MKLKSFIATLALLLSCVFAFGQMSILSGPEQGSYYEFVNDIIKVLDDGGNAEYVNVNTKGAADNLEKLLDPLCEDKVAFMQMDYLFYMARMDAQNNTKRTESLKVLLPMAREEIHFGTKKSSGIKKLEDINAKTIIDIGSKDQGTYTTSLYINERSGINWSQRSYHFDDSFKKLLLNEVEVFVIVGTSPMKKLDIDPRGLREEISLVELHDYNGWAKYYKRDTIRARDYKWLESDVPTYGVRSVLLVNEAKLNESDKELVKALERGVRANYSKLVKEGHSKWKNIELDNWDNSYWPQLNLK